jgi:hypothetical protein
MTRHAFRFPWRSGRDIRDDVDAELRFHLDTRAEELVARGLAPDAARRQALHEFGDVDDARRYMRTMDNRTEGTRRRRGSFDDLRQDVAYALRALKASPLFTLTAIVTLALGIGANVAIFSVVHSVLLRALPFPAPERLHRVWSANRADDVTESQVSVLDIEDWRAARRPGGAVADLGGWWYQPNGSGIDLSGRGNPQRLVGVYFTPGFFSTLGARPAAGRLPRDEEMVRGGPDKVVMLSYGFWQRQFGGDRSIVGTSLTLDREPYLVLGVLPPTFAFPTEQAEVYLPYSSIPDEAIPHNRENRLLGVVARAAPGATAATVDA